jgi:hypothetical protein
MDKNSLGNSLWKELHDRAYFHDGTNDQKFIDDFGKKIPKYMQGCSCNEFWNKWIKQNPPVFAKEKYFEWTVNAHNATNLKLKKPVMSIEDAKKIWASKIKN